MIRVVLFTGGRGSSVLSARLLADPGVDLTLAINGYDDGASTGDVRRFLGDSLGPSDFRKNASRVAAAKGTATRERIAWLDARLPAAIDAVTAVRDLRHAAQGHAVDWTTAAGPESSGETVGERLHAFLEALDRSGQPFRFADCAVGNLVFAGAFLAAGRRFNPALDDYCALLGLPPGIVDNVTDGTNACLVAVEEDGTVRGTEEALVSIPVATTIHDIFLIDRPLDDAECARLGALGRDGACDQLRGREVRVPLNPRLAERVDAADLIVYAPGTQYSSLFPSYLTDGLAHCLARNLRATKVLVTNLQTDTETARNDAATLTRRALHFMTGKGRHPLPSPCLVTHCLINDPGHDEDPRPVVPLGQLQDLEDPRMIRIDRFEDGESGHHDAAKVLQPFIEARLMPPQRLHMAILLYGATTETAVVQSLLEIARTPLARDPDLAVFIGGCPTPPPSLVERLPFAIESYGTLAEAEWWLRMAVESHEFDAVALFESDGGYRGEELVALVPYLRHPRVVAVWGSRRLSVRDIREAYRHRPYPDAFTRTASRVGSHVLSLAYLMFHGRYVHDTLTGLKVVQAGEYLRLPVPADHPSVNHHLLTGLLRRRADFLEVPVQYLPAAGVSRRQMIAAGLAGLMLVATSSLARWLSLSPWES